MKTLSLQMLLLCSAFLSGPVAQAAEPAGKNFASLTAGTSFILTVQEATSSRTLNTKVTRNVRIPKGIPKFKRGQQVKFTVGKKGELKGPGFSIAFLSSSVNSISYAKQPSSKSVSPNVASVFMDTSGTPVGATVTFYQYRSSDYTAKNLSINLVGYVFQ